MLKEPILGAVSPVYVVARPSPAYRSFMEFQLRRFSTRNWINVLASGSVRQSLSFSDFASIPCVVPLQNVLHAFDVQWSQHGDAIRAKAIQTETLAALRDALLPKLISGELRVTDVERYVSEERA